MTKYDPPCQRELIATGKTAERFTCFRCATGGKCTKGYSRNYPYTKEPQPERKAA